MNVIMLQFDLKKKNLESSVGVNNRAMCEAAVTAGPLTCAVS